MEEKLGIIFCDGKMIDLDNSSSDTLEENLEIIRKQMVEKINNISKIVKELQEI